MNWDWIYTAGFGVMGFLGVRQFQINDKVNTQETQISGLEDDVKYIRSRVDSIYDHLIEDSGRLNPRRRESE